MLHKTTYRHVGKLLFLSLFLALIGFGCSNTPSSSEEEQGYSPRTNQQSPFNHAANQASMPLIEHEGKSYFDMEQAIFRLQFNAKWSPGKSQFSFGDHDVVYDVTPGENTAQREEKQVSLSDPPILLENRLYITPGAWSDLLQGEVDFHLQDKTLVLHGLMDPWWEQSSDQRKLQKQLGFGESSFQALAAGDTAKVISRAKQYLGVPYEFGAEPYAQSDRFDCSSFIQHIYKAVGVNMPRVARNQANRGSSVSRSNLQVGDLMYFYVPGRFRAEKTVGHVAIYMGNNKMIHSSPSPKDGVQITDIDDDYWKRTYLRARRVL